MSARVGIRRVASRLESGSSMRNTLGSRTMALARAIVRDPKVFLMDEPLSNLDATLRIPTRADIVSLQRRLGTTTIYVTHDQVEAMTMGCLLYTSPSPRDRTRSR